MIVFLICDCRVLLWWYLFLGCGHFSTSQLQISFSLVTIMFNQVYWSVFSYLSSHFSVVVSFSMNSAILTLVVELQRLSFTSYYFSVIINQTICLTSLFIVLNFLIECLALPFVLQLWKKMKCDLMKVCFISSIFWLIIRIFQYEHVWVYLWVSCSTHLDSLFLLPSFTSFM